MKLPGAALMGEIRSSLWAGSESTHGGVDSAISLNSFSAFFPFILGFPTRMMSP